METLKKYKLVIFIIALLLLIGIVFVSTVAIITTKYDKYYVEVYRSGSSGSYYVNYHLKHEEQKILYDYHKDYETYHLKQKTGELFYVRTSINPNVILAEKITIYYTLNGYFVKVKDLRKAGYFNQTEKIKEPTIIKIGHPEEREPRSDNLRGLLAI
jgi:predicted membrane protein